MTGRATLGLFLVLSLGVIACGSSSAAPPPPPSGEGGSGGAGTGGAGTGGATGTGGAGAGGAATAGTGGTSSAGKGGSGATAGAGGATAGAAGTGTGAGGATPGACTNPMDAPIVAMKDATANNASMCGQSCFLDPDPSKCAGTCMQMKAGLSAGCATCWGAVIGCGIKNCAGPCIGGSMSQGCIDCNNQFCVPAFDTCAGKPLRTALLDRRGRSERGSGSLDPRPVPCSA